MRWLSDSLTLTLSLSLFAFTLFNLFEFPTAHLWGISQFVLFNFHQSICRCVEEEMMSEPNFSSFVGK